MNLERATKIVQACVGHVHHAMGLLEDAPPSIKEYSLAELVEAHRIVREDNARPVEGARTIQVSCDDRLVAALYAASHYDANDPAHCEPICTVGDTGLFALSLEAINAEHS